MDNNISCKLGIQNHGDMLATGNQVLYIMDYFLSKGYTNIGVVNDTGYYREFGEISYPDANWCYEEINRVLPVSSNFQLKKKARGAESMELIDLERIFRDIRSSGYLTENCIEANGARYVPVEVLWAPGDSDYPENAADIVESYKKQVSAFLEKVKQMVEETKTPSETPGKPEQPNQPGNSSNGGNSGPHLSNDPQSNNTSKNDVTNGVTVVERVDVGKVITVAANKQLSAFDVVYNTQTGTIVPYSAIVGYNMKFIATESGTYGIRPNEKTFIDTSGHWAEDTIHFIAARELFSGVGDGRFAPDIVMTRGMFVTVLARLDGADISGKSASFIDIQPGDWFEGAVAWAAETGIVYGVGGNRFDPNSSISREQMAVILNRYVDYKGIKLHGSQNNIAFTDGNAISDWSATAVGRMVQAGLLRGLPDGRLNPQGLATRAEVATMLMRFIQAALQ